MVVYLTNKNTESTLPPSTKVVGFRVVNSMKKNCKIVFFSKSSADISAISTGQKLKLVVSRFKFLKKRSLLPQDKVLKIQNKTHTKTWGLKFRKNPG